MCLCLCLRVLVFACMCVARLCCRVLVFVCLRLRSHSRVCGFVCVLVSAFAFASLYLFVPLRSYGSVLASLWLRFV